MMASRLDVNPENVLFVGDSVAHDITGARAAAGMRSVLIYQQGKPKSDLADHCVQGIGELHELLNTLI